MVLAKVFFSRKYRIPEFPESSPIPASKPIFIFPVEQRVELCVIFCCEVATVEIYFLKKAATSGFGKLVSTLYDAKSDCLFSASMSIQISRRFLGIVSPG